MPIRRVVIPLLALAWLAGCASSATSSPPARPAVVEAACGQCQFDLAGDGCDLAVRMDGRAYYVDGTGIDDHGDAHAADGFCNAVRRARVTGAVVDGRFEAESFVLLPAEE
jgi:hypothetical protein